MRPKIFARTRNFPTLPSTPAGVYTLEVMARGEGVLSTKMGEKPHNAISFRKVDFAQLAEIFGGKIMRSLTQVKTLSPYRPHTVAACWLWASRKTERR